MTSPCARPLLRGARIAKRGKHVVSWNACIGTLARAASGLALAGALWSAAPQFAVANQCGALDPAGGVVVCDPATYGTVNGAPSGAGAGTEESPGTTAIAYTGTRTIDTSIEVDDLFLRPASGIGVRLEVSGAEGTVASAITVQGETNIEGPLANNATAVRLLDGQGSSSGTTISVTDDARVVSRGGAAHAVEALQTGATATGGVTIAVQGDARITALGQNGLAVNADQSGANATGNVSFEITDRALVQTAGAGGIAARARQSGALATGDVIGIVTGQAIIQTSNGGAIGAQVTQSGASASGDVSLTIEGDAQITTTGGSAHGSQAVQSGNEATGDVTLTVRQAARITTHGSSARGAHAQQSGTAQQGHLSLLLTDDATIETFGGSAHGVLAEQSAIANAGLAGDLTLTVDGKARITTAGASAIGANAVQSGADSTGKLTVVIADEARIQTTHTNASAVEVRQSGANATGDMEVTVRGSAQLLTSGNNSRGVWARQSGANATGDLRVTVTENALIDTGTGTNAHGAFAEKTGATAASGNVELVVDGAARIVTAGQGSSGALASYTGSDASGSISVTIGGSAHIHTQGAFGTSGNGDGAAAVQNVTNGSGNVNLTVEGNARIEASWNGALAQLNGVNSTGDMTLIVRDQAHITTTGVWRHGAFAQRQGANGQGTVRLIVEGDARIEALGPSSHAAYGYERGIGSSGDIIILVKDRATLIARGTNGYALHGWWNREDGRGNVDITVAGEAYLEASGAQSYGAIGSGGAAGSTGNVALTVQDDARIVASGALGAGALAQTGIGPGTALLTVKDRAHITASGVQGHGTRVMQVSVDPDGPITLIIQDSARVEALGTSGVAALSTISGLGNTMIALRDQAEASASGLRGMAVSAQVGEWGTTEPALDGDGNPVFYRVLDANGDPAVDGDGNPQLAAATNFVVHSGSNNALVEMSGGTARSSGDMGRGLDARNASLAGGAFVNQSGGQVEVAGETAIGVAASIIAPTKVAIDPETGLAIATPVRDSEGTIALYANGAPVLDFVRIAAPERRVDSEGNIIMQTGRAEVRVADASVTVAGAGVTGALTENAGAGDSLIALACGTVSATGANATTLAARSTGTGNLTVDVDACSNVVATGTGATGIGAAISNAESSGGIAIDVAGLVEVAGEASRAIDISGPVALGQTVTIAQTGQITNNASDGLAVRIEGGGGALINAGAIIGGIDIAGSLSNSGAISLVGAQTFRLTGSAVNTGLIDLSQTSDRAAMTLGGDLAHDGTMVLGMNTLDVGGNLSGSGEMVARVDFATGDSGRLVVGQNLTGALKVTLNNAGQQVTAAGLKALEVITVEGTVTGDVRLKDGPLNLGTHLLDLGVVDGQVVKIVHMTPEAATHAALPDVVGGDLAVLGNQPDWRIQRVRDRIGGAAPAVSISSKGRVEMASAVGTWASIEGESSRRAFDSGSTTDLSTWLFEGGLDHVVDVTSEGALILGAGVRLASIRGDVRSAAGRGDIAANGNGVMLAATYLHQAGTYLDAQFNFMRIASDLSDTTGASLVSGVISTAPVGSIKLGHTFDLGDGAGLTPHLKLARGQVRTKAHVDAEGRDVAASRKQIRELTAGAEYATMLAEGAKFSLFGDYTRDLAPDSHVSVNGFDLASSGPRDWAKIGMRLETPVGKRSGLSGEVFYQTAFGDGSGGNRDLSGRVAVDIRW